MIDIRLEAKFDLHTLEIMLIIHSHSHSHHYSEKKKTPITLKIKRYTEKKKKENDIFSALPSFFKFATEKYEYYISLYIW